MLLNCGVEESWDSWTARRSTNQWILKGLSPEYSLEWILKLKLQYYGQLMWRTNSLEKILMLGKIEGRRRRGWQDDMVGWHPLTQCTWAWASSGDGDGQGTLACGSPWSLKESDTTEQLNWSYNSKFNYNII